MSKPNLFSFATSELSQDAFICWLVSWVNNPEEKELNVCAKDFVCMLYNLNKGSKISSNDINKVTKPERQYYDIDVFFQAEIGDKTVSFVVEDKVHTSHHSNQLQRYKEKIENDEIKEDEIVLIYYKTGYIFDWDNQVVNYGYSILKSEKIIDFLGKYQITNPIFIDYLEYIKTKFSYNPIIAELFSAKDGYKHFSNDYAQVEFIKKLMEDSLDNINCYSMSNGKSFGKPYTILNFAYFQKAILDYDDVLYYRIDIRKNKEISEKQYFLGIFHYSKYPKNNHEVKEKKKERLKKFIDIFNKIKPQEISSLKFSMVNQDHSGDYQSDIAVLFFNEKENTVFNVVKELPKVHNAFLKKIREEMIK